MPIDCMLEIMPTGEAKVIKVYKNGSALIEFVESGIRLVFTDYWKFVDKNEDKDE